MLGKALLDKMGLEESLGELIGVLSEVRMYCEPSKAANEWRKIGSERALKSGDTHWACLLHLQFCISGVFSGEKLPAVSELFTKARVLFQQHNHKFCISSIMTAHRLVLFLMGRENEFLEARSNPSPHIKTKLSFYNLYVSFLMDNNTSLRETCESFRESDLKNVTFIVYAEALRSFIAGLAYFRLYRKSRDSMWLRRGQQHTQEMEVWARQGCSYNFEHRFHLMKAEEQFSNGELEVADQSYKKAISSAKAHNHLSDEALACEIYGKFLLAKGNISSSLDYFTLAHEKYVSYGAVAKATQLFAQINVQFARRTHSFQCKG